MAIAFNSSLTLSDFLPQDKVADIPERAAALRRRLTQEPHRARYRELAEAHAKTRARLGALRASGYLWMPQVEQRALGVVEAAEAVTAALHEGPVHVPKAAMDRLDAAEQQAIALAGVPLTEELAGAVVHQFNTTVPLYESPLEPVVSALQTLAHRLDRLNALLAALEEVQQRFAAASFKPQAGEQPVAALTATWKDAADGEHKGMLYLTQSHVRFERDEEIVEGGVFGLFARSRRKVREVELTLPLAQLQDAAGSESGFMMMKSSVLTFSWAPGSPGAPVTTFKVSELGDLPEELDEPEEWAELLERLAQASAQRDRVEAEAWRGVPDLPHLAGDAPPEPAPAPVTSAPAIWPAEAWMQVEIDLDGDALEVALTASSSGQQTPPQRVEGLGLADVQAFADAVRQTAHRGAELPAAALAQAHELFTLLLDRDLVGVLHALGGAARAHGGKLLLRLMVGDARLRGLPWEVMRGPGREDGFLAMNPDLTMVRGVYGSEPVDAPPVTERPRLLVVAPGELGPSGQALAERLAAAHGGAIELQPPLLGDAATWAELSGRLMGPNPPHVLHAVVHGRLDGGLPELQLAGGWVPAELLALALKPAAAKGLRLAYLESCETAHAGELASAAELIARRGVEAVVAQLWPVSPEGARAVSSGFYGALLGQGPEAGDVAASLNAARLAAAAQLRSAEFLCPVLYLRGEDPRLFTRG